MYKTRESPTVACNSAQTAVESGAKTLIAIPGPSDPFGPGSLADLPVAGPILRALAANPYERVILADAPPSKRLLAEIEERFPGIQVNTCSADEIQGGAQNDFLVSGPLPQQLTLLGAVLDGRLQARPVFLSPDPLSPELLDLPLLPPLQTGTHDIHAPVVREPSSSYACATPPPPASISRRTVHPQAVVKEIGLIGASRTFTRAIDQASTIAEHHVPVLIQGETGTGKELFARLIHQLSPRRNGPFIAVNCGALPAQLIESILFGHRKGAFTGALQEQAGKFTLADGGTLFLDELGELPIELQPKLLRVLEDGMVEALGARQAHKVDVRVVAATNLALNQAMAENQFREDLFYRLSTATIKLPALRERSDDIPRLVCHLLNQINHNLAEPRQLSPAALTRLAHHTWPGNIRELQNTLQRSVLWSVCPLLEAEDLIFDEPRAPSDSSDALDHLPTPEPGFSMEAYLDQVRKQLMLRALELSDGNQSAAARLLDLSPQAVSKFLRRAE